MSDVLNRLKLFQLSVYEHMEGITQHDVILMLKKRCYAMREPLTFGDKREIRKVIYRNWIHGKKLLEVLVVRSKV